MPNIDCLAVWRKCLKKNENANMQCYSKFNQNFTLHSQGKALECKVRCGEMNKEIGPPHTTCGGSCGGNCPKHSNIWDGSGYEYFPGQEVDINCYPFCKETGKGICKSINKSILLFAFIQCGRG